MDKVILRNAWYIPERELSCAWDMLKICLSYASDMEKICLKYARDMLERSLRYAWDMYEICQRHAWDMGKMCQRYIWDMSEISLRYAQWVSEWLSDKGYRYRRYNCWFIIIKLQIQVVLNPQFLVMANYNCWQKSLYLQINVYIDFSKPYRNHVYFDINNYCWSHTIIVGDFNYIYKQAIIACALLWLIFD